MPSNIIDRASLKKLEGQHISKICTAVRFVDDGQNHCAHFVNHVLSLEFDMTCGRLLGRGGPSGNIRVHETFAACPSVGEFGARTSEDPCFAFVTKRSAVDLTSQRMQNIPKKHVGIYCDGDVWHYSNAKKKVVAETPEVFVKHFPGPGFALFFGTFPAHAAQPLVNTQAKAPMLREGQTDNVDVAVWQQFLILRGLLFGAPLKTLLDGDFGPRTKEATEAFQIACGLPETGKVDAATNSAAIERGFIPRTQAKTRTALKTVSPAVAEMATEALGRLGPANVFYTEEAVTVSDQRLIARLEPHKHTSGDTLRNWHRGITVYPA